MGEAAEYEEALMRGDYDEPPDVDGPQGKPWPPRVVRCLSCGRYYLWLSKPPMTSTVCSLECQRAISNARSRYRRWVRNEGRLPTVPELAKILRVVDVWVQPYSAEDAATYASESVDVTEW